MELVVFVAGKTVVVGSKAEEGVIWVISVGVCVMVKIGNVSIPVSSVEVEKLVGLEIIFSIVGLAIELGVRDA